MYYELSNFELIMGETCQYECEKLVNCINANQPVLAQTYLY